MITRSISSLLFLVLVSQVSLSPALAAKKKSKSIKLNGSEQIVESDLGECYRDPSNGNIVLGKRNKKGTAFTRFKPNKNKKRILAKKVKIFTKKAKKNPSKFGTKLERFQAKLDAQDANKRLEQCTLAFARFDQGGGSGGGGNGSGGGGSSTITLATYKGPFTKIEAAKLYRRYAFGATYEELARAEREGLEATVNRLLDWNQSCENELAESYYDIRCDGERAYWDANPELEDQECNLANPNDFSMEGLKRAMYYRFQNTCNPAHFKFMTVVHSRNASGQINSLPESKKWFATQHFEGLLTNFARTWDYGQFIKEQAVGDPNGLETGDPLVNFFNLDGGASFAIVGQDGQTRKNANENYGRELLELGTVGVVDTYTDPANPRPTYGLLDIISASNALAGGGYVRRSFEVGVNNNGEPIIADIDYTIVPDANTIKGPKLMWIGTPYETTIDTAEDLVESIKQHPMTAQNMAHKLLLAYVGDEVSRPVEDLLADKIRKNNLNVREAMKALMMAEFNFDGSSPRYQTTFEFILSFLRSTKIPMRLNYVSAALTACGQEAGASQNMNAGQIFGWDRKALVGESYSVPCRNSILKLLEYIPTVQNQLKKDTVFGSDYSMVDEALLSDKPYYYRGDVWAAEKLSTLFGEKLTPAQLDYLISEVMNKRPELCDRDNEVTAYGCERGTYFRVTDPWSEDPTDNNKHAWKISDLLAVLVTRSSYRVIQ